MPILSQSTGVTLPAIHVVWIVIWMTLVVVLIASLAVLIFTKWGRTQPMRFCVVLSLLAHVLLAGYAATVQIAAAQAARRPPAIEVSLVDDRGHDDDSATQTTRPTPWERLDTQQLEEPDFEPLARRDPVDDGMPNRSSLDDPPQLLAALAPQSARQSSYFAFITSLGHK
jgi:hypothetical protein